MNQSKSERCEELKSALSAQQSLLADSLRDDYVVASGGSQAGLPVESTIGDPTGGAAQNAGVEQEIARLEAALRENGCV